MTFSLLAYVTFPFWVISAQKTLKNKSKVGCLKVQLLVKTPCGCSWKCSFGRCYLKSPHKKYFHKTRREIRQVVKQMQSALKGAECIKRYRLLAQSRTCQRGSGMTCWLMLSSSAYRSEKQMVWWQGKGWHEEGGHGEDRGELPLTGRMTCLDGCWWGL